MRILAIVFLLAGVAYGIWSLDDTLMLERQVTCAPTLAMRM